MVVVGRNRREEGRDRVLNQSIWDEEFGMDCCATRSH